jgi:methionine synthase I (cobalamin-dependent)
MGSQLAARGVTPRNSSEANLSHPELVAAIHRDYREAGAEVFQTNTFAANRFMLERAGLADQAGQIQTAAVSLLRDAVGPDAYVALNVGPTGHLLEPLGDLTAVEAEAGFRAQLESMLGLGVDFVLFETFEALEELEAAVRAARSLAVAIPLAATISFSNPVGTTMMGTDGSAAANALNDLGLDIVGANCGHPEGLATGLSAMAEHTNLPLMAQANAGAPLTENGETVYRQSPEDFGRYCQQLVEMGVSIIGGCCGTTPEHIRQLVRVARAEA